MENLNGKRSNNYLANNNNNHTPFYHSSFSCSSNWSYLSGSSGFGSDCQFDQALDLSLENDFSNSAFSANQPLNHLQQQQEQINQQQCYQEEAFNIGSTQSLDSLMDSEVFVNDSNLVSANFVDMVNSNVESAFDEANFNTLSYEANQMSKISFSNGSIQMWQFLLELLEDKRCRHLIRWRSNEKNIHDNEFVIYDPNEIVRRWAIRHAKPNMNYKKFCRILRYYYKNKILQKTAGMQIFLF